MAQETNQEETNFGFYLIILISVLAIGFGLFLFYKLKHRKNVEVKIEVVQENNQDVPIKEDQVNTQVQSQQDVPRKEIQTILRVCESNKGLRMCEFRKDGTLVNVISP